MSSSPPPPPPPPSQPPYGQQPGQPPSGLPNEVRNWGMGAHLSSLVGAFMGGAPAFLGPLIIWLVKRDEHPFIEHHAKEALNFNLSVLLYAAISLVLALLLIGFLLLLALGIAYLVLTVVAAMKAANGEGYRYPMTIRFVS